MTVKAKVGITGRREANGTHIDLEFSNGTKRSFHLAKEHPLYDDLAAHGFSKKIRDQVSACKTPEEMVEAYDGLASAFNKGKWNMLRNSDGSKVVGILATALARLYGRSLEASQKFVSSLSKKQQADCRKDPRVQAIIAQIAAEKPAEEGSTSDLLASFGDQSEVQEEPTNGELFPESAV